MIVRLDPRAIACWPFLPVSAPPRTWWQGPCGELVRVLEDGMAEPLLPGGYPHAGPASDPCAGRRPRRTT